MSDRASERCHLTRVARKEIPGWEENERRPHRGSLQRKRQRRPEALPIHLGITHAPAHMHQPDQPQPWFVQFDDRLSLRGRGQRLAGYLVLRALIGEQASALERFAFEQNAHRWRWGGAVRRQWDSCGEYLKR